MTKCIMCKKNVAVVFTTRFESGQRISEGLCLKCAYRTGLGGMDELFAKAGINDGNIDELTDRMNNVMSQMDGQSPENIFRSLISGGLDLEGFTESLQINDDDSEEDGKPRNELLPASIGGESEDRSEERRGG